MDAQTGGLVQDTSMDVVVLRGVGNDGRFGI